MNRKYGKLDEGVLIFAPVNLIIDDMQVFNAEEADYLAAGYLPIEYKTKPDDNEWQSVYTEVDGVILQSWIYEGRIHDHSNLPLLEGVTPKSLSGVPAVHTLPTDAKDGDMCLYSPMNIIESGKRIYFDWQEFAKPVDGGYEIFGQTVLGEDVPFDFDASRGESCHFRITINPGGTSNIDNCVTEYYMSFDEDGNLCEGAVCTKYHLADDIHETTYYSSIYELPKYIDIPVFDSWQENECFDAFLEAPVPFFYAPYRLMVYRAGEWHNANELFSTDCTAIEKVRIPEQDLLAISLRPNVFYDFGERISVYIHELIEGDHDKRNEYMFSFISGETATEELTLPDDIVWENGKAPTIQPNATYIVTIVDNIASYVTTASGEKSVTQAEMQEYVANALEDLPESSPVDLTDYYTKQEIDDKGFITAEDIPQGDFSQFVEEISGSANLYPPTTEGWTNSAVLNSAGVITPNTKNNQFVTPQIYVEPNTQYSISNIFGWDGTPLVDHGKGRAYSVDGTALVSMTFSKNADGSYGFTTPENASYVLLCGYKYGMSSATAPIETIIELFNNRFMLVKGTKLPSEYEPFGDVKFKLKNILLPNKSVSLENVADEALPVFAPLAGKTIVNFGDSIFGNQQPPNDISTFLAEKTGATVYNCGFGGCRMSVHPTSEYNAFSMYSLANSIASGDYTTQETALESTAVTLPERFTPSVERLKGIDFSKVDIVTIAYGSNDFSGYGVNLDNKENPLDINTFGGALRYSIETLLTAYPNLKIFVLSIAYRYWIDENNAFVDDTNTHTNSGGKLTADFNAKLKEVAKEYNLPYVDDYNIGIGKFNRTHYFGATDPAHHKEEGRWLIAEHLASALTVGSSACVSGIDKVVISVTSAKLNANKVYDFGTATELTITFDNADPTKYNEYNFTFTSGETPTVLTLPSSVQWVNELTVEANKRYEISIVDNIGLWCAVDLAVTE